MTDDYKSVSQRKKRWTETEKRILLRGLKTYGYEDISKLKHLLPNRSASAIQQMINKYKAMAELGTKESNSPLDIWMRSGIFNEEDNMIPEALLFIHLFEDHPPPEETAGFDLKQAYKLLYETLSGNPITDIPRLTAEMLKQLVITVDKEIWPGNENITTDYLIYKLSSSESEKSYKRKKNDDNYRASE